MCGVLFSRQLCLYLRMQPHSGLVQFECLRWRLADGTKMEPARAAEARKHMTTGNVHRINFLLEANFTVTVLSTSPFAWWSLLW